MLPGRGSSCVHTERCCATNQRVLRTLRSSPPGQLLPPTRLMKSEVSNINTTQARAPRSVSICRCGCLEGRVVEVLHHSLHLPGPLVLMLGKGDAEVDFLTLPALCSSTSPIGYDHLTSSNLTSVSLTYRALKARDATSHGAAREKGLLAWIPCCPPRVVSTISPGLSTTAE